MPRKSAKDKVIEELTLRVEVLKNKLAIKDAKIERLQERLRPFIKQEAEERQLLVDEENRIKRLVEAEEANMLLKERKLRQINREIRRLLRKRKKLDPKDLIEIQKNELELKEKHREIDELHK
jgi:BioD-like phosphotransacetylase family protein